MQSYKISIVIPAFNEKDNIEEIVNSLLINLNKYKDYEIIFVDDGSTDGTLEKIKELNHKNKKIRYISFSRNFGHQIALKAGLDNSVGDCVISMDCDMQHPPELIDVLIDKWLEGYDVVYTIRNDEKNVSFLKRKTATFFYRMINRLADVKIPKGAADFRLLDKKVVDTLKSFQETNPFFRGIISWMGYKQYAISYTANERFSGESKYTVKKMISFALTGITSFSVKPLHLTTMLGVCISIISALYIIYAIVMKIFTKSTLSGWTSILVSILFLGGLQLIMLGIIGEYLGKLFIESKKRPIYIIKDKSE